MYNGNKMAMMMMMMMVSRTNKRSTHTIASIRLQGGRVDSFKSIAGNSTINRGIMNFWFIISYVELRVFESVYVCVCVCLDSYRIFYIDRLTCAVNSCISHSFYFPRDINALNIKYKYEPLPIQSICCYFSMFSILFLVDDGDDD